MISFYFGSLFMILIQAHENLMMILSTMIVVRCSALSSPLTSSDCVITPSTSVSISVMISSTTFSTELRLWVSLSGIKW